MNAKGDYPPAPWKYDVSQKWVHGVDTKAKSNVPAVKLQKMKFKWKDVKGEAQEIVKAERFKPKAIDKSVIKPLQGIKENFH